MAKPDEDIKSHDQKSQDNSSPTCKIPLQATAGDGGHGNETDKLQQKSPSEETTKSIPSSVEISDSPKEPTDDVDIETGTPSTNSPEKGDSCVVSMEVEEDKNHGNNKSPSSSGKVHVVSAEITPEPKQSPTPTNSSSHSNQDVDVCVVTKEGVTKQDEIKYIDESPTDNSSKVLPVSSDNPEDVVVMEMDQNKADIKPKEIERKEIFGNMAKEKDKPFSNGKNKQSKSKAKENTDHDINMNSSNRPEKRIPSEMDKLLNGSVTAKDVVVEDMSNVDEKMPITKL